jgi:hypothetical protein
LPNHSLICIVLGFELFEFWKTFCVVDFEITDLEEYTTGAKWERKVLK